MEKKFYLVETYKIDFNEDVSNMKKDYTVFENAYYNGMEKFANFIVYLEDGKYKELLSGIEIPYMEEKIYVKPYDKIPEYPDAEIVEYHYNLKGDYPIFFFLNKLDEANESLFTKLNDVPEGYLEEYKEFIKRRYSDSNGNYLDKWSSAIKEDFIDNLFTYTDILEDNGYSEEFIKQYKKEM